MQKRIRKDKGHINSHRISAHANVRGQQRGIPESLMHLVLMYGKEEYTRDGALSYALDKHGRKKVEEFLRNGMQKLDKLQKIKIVVSGDDGVVITCYHI